ncbi:MAG: aspartate kinase, partial [Chroococcidiopsis sp.]
MALIVQKYGGTSVGSVERIQAVADRVLQTVKAGNALVVVVSAMGKSTDALVKLAHEVSANPSRREMDMLLSTGEQVTIALLSMALQELGQPAISLTGAQVGIVTEAEHTRARILHIQTSRIEKQLKIGKVVVVAGFQGITSTEELEITTLGRGGSDTSAVALAAALRADCCEIYTDVPGILTTDPRLVPEAQLMTEITCNEMLELASLGAKVLHPRAVEIARNYGVPLVVRSSWTSDPGTWVVSPKPQPRPLVDLEIARPVDGVELDADQARIALLRVPDRPGIAARLFSEIARQGLDVDLIVQSIHEGNSNDIAFTVTTSLLKQTEAVAAAIAPVLRSHPDPKSEEAEVMVQPHIAKVSIDGAGMIGRPGVAAQMFLTLAEAGINIQMISTSEVKVSCVIDATDGDRAVTALREAFEIVEERVVVEKGAEEQRSRGAEEAILATSRQPLATLPTPPVRGVALDINQARLAILQVPDRPGLAARLFGLLARENISVDTIIQSQRCRIANGVPKRDIVCTVAQMDATAAKQILERAAIEYGWGQIVVDTAIAKVSV